MKEIEDEHLSPALHARLQWLSDEGYFSLEDNFVALLLKRADRDALIVRRAMKSLSKRARKQPLDSGLNRGKEKFKRWELELDLLGTAMYEANLLAEQWSERVLKNKALNELIAGKAKEVARLIEDQLPFKYPNAHHFFNGGVNPEVMTPEADGFQFGDGDFIPISAVLRNFAGYCEWLIETAKDSTEKSFKNTPRVELRIVANHLHRYFMANFGKPEDGAVAACVSLMFSDDDDTNTSVENNTSNDKEVTVTEALVRKWTGRS